MTRLQLGGSTRCLSTWALMVTMGLAAHASAEPLSPARQREILRDALNSYDQAVSVARDDPTHAAELYRQAAAGFHALCDAGLTSSALEYNLGNAYFRLGELGKAILHYRRAERLAPGDERLGANLRYARGRVEPAIAPSGQRRLTRQLLFWHYDTSLRQRFWALAVFSAVGWLLLFLWLRWRVRLIAITGVVALALALAVGSSLLWQINDDARCPPAVLIAGEQYLRLGRGEGSDLALQQPLGPGVELRILQQRGDWIEVRLPNDQTGWLPASAAERV